MTFSKFWLALLCFGGFATSDFSCRLVCWNRGCPNVLQLFFLLLGTELTFGLAKKGKKHNFEGIWAFPWSFMFIIPPWVQVYHKALLIVPIKKKKKSTMSAVSGVISRKVLPACGNLCFFCPALRARSRQPVKRYKKLISDIFPRGQVRFWIICCFTCYSFIVI